MAAVTSYPGVYIEEVPSGVRTITGVATSITAFIGRARRGPVNRPVRVQSYSEYSRLFGALWQESTMGYAVSHFYQHGGRDALIVRVFNGDVAACCPRITLNAGAATLVLAAANPGRWGLALRATVDHATNAPGDEHVFNLLIEALDRPGGTTVIASERFRNVSVAPGSVRFIGTVLAEQSALMRVVGEVPATRPSPASASAVSAFAAEAEGDEDEEEEEEEDEEEDEEEEEVAVADEDGAAITVTQIDGDQAARTGLYALEGADLFNLLCIPPLAAGVEVPVATWGRAAGYCQARRAMLIVDTPEAWAMPVGSAIANAVAGVNALRAAIGNAFAINAMAYFPRLRMPDPLQEGRLATFAPCGAVAGIIARTDARRGVWKAPAGQEASFAGTQGLDFTMTDLQNGQLNPLGLNCLRSFPVSGHLVWGARTLAGADQLASEWKYIPVRRLALFIEESLFRGTQWVVFEPNDEPLWAQIRLNLGAFMQGLFRQGAFQGTSARDAYFVKCDRETTTQNDIDRGVVNILVGFAPLKPAEFVVIHIQQMAGQVEV